MPYGPGTYGTQKGRPPKKKKKRWQEIKVKVEIVQRGTYFFWVIEDEGSLVEGYTTSLIDALDEIAIERGEATFSPVE